MLLNHSRRRRRRIYWSRMFVGPIVSMCWWVCVTFVKFFNLKCKATKFTIAISNETLSNRTYLKPLKTLIIYWCKLVAVRRVWKTWKTPKNVAKTSFHYFCSPGFRWENTKTTIHYNIIKFSVCLSLPDILCWTLHTSLQDVVDCKIFF